MFKSIANRVLFTILFAVPLLVVIYYELAIASDRYQSEASLIISEENSGQTTFDLA